VILVGIEPESSESVVRDLTITPPGHPTDMILVCVLGVFAVETIINATTTTTVAITSTPDPKRQTPRQIFARNISKAAVSQKSVFCLWLQKLYKI